MSDKFKKGHIPWNKGKKDFRPSPKTEFTKERFEDPKNHPSWEGGVQKHKNDCVHVHRKGAKNNRVRRPIAVYEEHFGPIPKGYVIIHKDGNKHNDDPSNLEAISRVENLKRNQNKKL